MGCKFSEKGRSRVSGLGLNDTSPTLLNRRRVFTAPRMACNSVLLNSALIDHSMLCLSLLWPIQSLTSYLRVRLGPQLSSQVLNAPFVPLRELLSVLSIMSCSCSLSSGLSVISNASCHCDLLEPVRAGALCSPRDNHLPLFSSISYS